MSSDVRSAQSLCSRGCPSKDEVQQQGSEEDSEEHVLSFYTGIYPCAVRAAHAIRAALLDKSPLASPHTFLQVLVAVFSKARKR